MNPPPCRKRRGAGSRHYRSCHFAVCPRQCRCESTGYPAGVHTVAKVSRVAPSGVPGSALDPVGEIHAQSYGRGRASVVIAPVVRKYADFATSLRRCGFPCWLSTSATRRRPAAVHTKFSLACRCDLPFPAGRGIAGKSPAKLADTASGGDAVAITGTVQRR